MNTENQNIDTQTNPVERPLNGAGNPTVENTKASRRSRATIVVVVILVLVIGLIAGIIPRLFAQKKLAAEAAEATKQTVAVTSAARVSGDAKLSLPGDIHAYQETRIYARADGYLLKWNADIGAKVEAGQVLAEIDTPELDQELNQSRAALNQAQANLALAKSTAERWQGLLKDRAVSQQEVDEKNSTLAARDADVKAAEAAVSRLQQLTDFKQIRAPFAGTVTRRFVDTGALIHAGGSGAASALFDLAQMDTLRVHVNVPQAYLRDVAVGSAVQVHVAEYPDRSFTGQVTRTSGAFDPTTRTLLTEIEVPNKEGALFPGIHVDVDLSLAQSAPPLMVPSTSVMSRSQGTQIAVVDESDAIRLQKVQLGRDFGQTVEIVAGLQDGARVVTNPSDTLVDGLQVKVAGQPAAKVAAVAAPAQLAKR